MHCAEESLNIIRIIWYVKVGPHSTLLILSYVYNTAITNAMIDEKCQNYKSCIEDKSLLVVNSVQKSHTG